MSHLRVARLLGIVFLGLVTTVGVAGACARFVSVQNHGGLVALDGDHLQPWLIEVRAPGAQRTIWFEKGRIYPFADRGPPQGRSCAVACWSFATSTRQNTAFSRGTVELSEEMERLIRQTPQTSWGFAEDRRGWPLPALMWRAAGTLDRASPDVYVLTGALPMRNDKPGAGPGTLAQIQAFPLLPVWPGFALDVLLFSGGWWVLFAAIGTVRSASRRHRGHCPACGYDLGGDPGSGCPECGWGRPVLPAPAPDPASSVVRQATAL